MQLTAKDLRVGNKLLFSPKAAKHIIEPRVVTVMEIGFKFCLVEDLGLPMNLAYNSPNLGTIPLTEECFLQQILPITRELPYQRISRGVLTGLY